jgi:Domain of unknown function (DUF4136)
MKRSIYLALTALMISALSACSSYDYYTAAINKTNLSSYHTFAWMPPADNGAKKMANSEADAKIRDAATAALSAKGLRLSQRNPDLVVSYTTSVGRGARTNYYTPGYYGGGWGGYYGGWGGWGFGYGFGFGWGGYYRPYYNYYGGAFAYGGPTYAEKEHFKEGTLIIDLIDPRSRKIVWRGFGVGEVHSNPQKNVDDLPKVVNGVIDQLKLTPTYASR